MYCSDFILFSWHSGSARQDFLFLTWKSWGWENGNPSHPLSLCQLSAVDMLHQSHSAFNNSTIIPQNPRDEGKLDDCHSSSELRFDLCTEGCGHLLFVWKQWECFSELPKLSVCVRKVQVNQIKVQ